MQKEFLERQDFCWLLKKLWQYFPWQKIFKVHSFNYLGHQFVSQIILQYNNIQE